MFNTEVDFSEMHLPNASPQNKKNVTNILEQSSPNFQQFFCLTLFIFIRVVGGQGRGGALKISKIFLTKFVFPHVKIHWLIYSEQWNFYLSVQYWLSHYKDWFTLKSKMPRLVISRFSLRLPFDLLWWLEALSNT